MVEREYNEGDIILEEGDARPVCQGNQNSEHAVFGRASTARK